MISAKPAGQGELAGVLFIGWQWIETVLVIPGGEAMLGAVLMVVVKYRSNNIWLVSAIPLGGVWIPVQ